MYFLSNEPTCWSCWCPWSGRHKLHSWTGGLQNGWEDGDRESPESWELDHKQDRWNSYCRPPMCAVHMKHEEILHIITSNWKKISTTNALLCSGFVWSSCISKLNEDILKDLPVFFVLIVRFIKSLCKSICAHRTDSLDCAYTHFKDEIYAKLYMRPIDHKFASLAQSSFQHLYLP